MKFLSTAALLTPAVSALSQYCPSPSICYTLSIPASTANTDSGPIFFQLNAPTTNSWVALGQGTQMAGSNIFVMYTSANGVNVTLSSRSGTGHVMPKYNAAAQVTLLQGSGVKDGMMVANVKCENCQSWTGGKMDFTTAGDGASWIWAVKSGDSLNSDDPNAAINQHSMRGSFKFDFATAKGGDNVNPFVGAGTTPSPTGPVVTTTIAVSGSGSGASNGGSASNNLTRILVAHGVLASLAFVILFPAGAISIRVLSFPGLIWFHAAVQCVAYLMFIAAFGLGIYMATNFGMMDNAHPRIGILLLLVLFFQPPLAYIHHIYFKRLCRRSWWSYAHLWLGRIAITLGIINGGLGLHLANNTESGKLAYGVIAAIVWVAYAAAAVYGERERKRNNSPDYREIVPRSGQSSMELQAHERYGKSSFLGRSGRVDMRSLSTGVQRTYP